MSVFPDWQQYAVQQKRGATGCIPTGYQMLLKAANAKEINWDSFQDDFDLDQDGGEPKNNFDSVANAIKKKYPNVVFRSEEFPKGKGQEKLKRVEDFIKQKRPVLVSVAQSEKGGWHIMPVVDIEGDSLVLLHHVDSAKDYVTEKLSKNDFVNRHNQWEGGKDIAYLEKSS